MNVFFLEIHNLRRSNIIHTLYICVAMFMMFAFFPTMQNDSMKALTNAKIEGLKGFSPTILAAFGLLDFIINFSIITNFFGYLIRYIALAIMVLVVQQAVALTVKEESDGTIEYLCSKPISRNELFFQKLLAHIIIFFVMTIVFCMVGILGYVMVGVIVLLVKR